MISQGLDGYRKCGAPSCGKSSRMLVGETRTSSVLAAQSRKSKAAPETTTLGAARWQDRPSRGSGNLHVRRVPCLPW